MKISGKSQSMKTHLIQSLSWLVLIVASAFILWGQAEIIHIVELLLVFMILRGLRLFSQWNQKALSEEEREALAIELVHKMTDEEAVMGENDLAGYDASQELDKVLSSPEYAWRLNAIYSQSVPRSRADILSEAACLVIMMPAVFLVGLMLTQELVTLSGSTRWNVGVALAASVAGYFVLNIVSSKCSAVGIRLRWAVMLTALIITGVTVCAKHPYLLQSGAERRRQMAERVWNMGFLIEACRHADVLFAYAKDLAEAGRIESAAAVYERGLMMEPHNNEARHDLVVLYEKSGRDQDAQRHRNMMTPRNRSSDRLFAQLENIRPLPEVAPKRHSRFVICLVGIGDVPDALFDRVGAEVAARLGVEVGRYSRKLDLPDADRVNGLRGGRQWNVDSLFKAFSAQGAPFPTGAC